MPTSIKISLLLLLLCASTSCQKVQELISGSEPSQHVVGGYTKPHSLSDQEQEIFLRATASLQGVEYKPMNVATQIVAGVNYRFLCKAWRLDEKGKRDKRYYATIVVHKPLAADAELQILSIERQSR